MSCERMEALLHDHVDGLLEDAERRRLEAHLWDCEACAGELAALERLRREVAELPRSIEPSRDLWPGIAGRLSPRARVLEGHFGQRRGAAAGRSRWRPDRVQWAAMAAAALLLVTLSAGITAWWMGSGEPGGAGLVPAGSPLAGVPADTTGVPVGPAGGMAGVPAEVAGPLRGAQSDYAVAIEGLLWVLYEHRDDLDPATVTALETNLRVVDRAIDRAREALEEDPADPGLARLLSQQYRRKLELLQRANRIIERS